MTEQDFTRLRELFLDFFEPFATSIQQNFIHIDEQFEQVNRRFDGVDKRLDGVEQRLDGVEQRLDRVEITQKQILRRLDHHETLFAEIFAELKRINQRLDALERHMAQAKLDIDELKEDVSELKGDVSELKGDVGELKDDMREVKIRLTRLEEHKDAEADELRFDIQALQTQYGQLDRRVAVLEAV